MDGTKQNGETKMTRLNMQDVKEITSTLKALSNLTRFKIVCSLNESPKTWTQLIFGFGLNPKALRDYLRILRSARIVKIHHPTGYELTDKGKFLLIKLSEYAKVFAKCEVKQK